jgi:hypothetical protein
MTHIVSEYIQHVNRYVKTVGSLSKIIVPDNVDDADDQGVTNGREPVLLDGVFQTRRPVDKGKTYLRSFQK